ncbi:hypothetical protein BST61_g5437 [Cercospora zeina]
MNPAASPRHRNNKQRQNSGAAQGRQQQDNMGQGNAPRGRPISYAGGRVPATPAKEQAYAGPTFQASPAASALPMPKFSKSVPSAAARGSLSARLAAEKASDSEQSSPEADVVAPVAPPQEVLNSPLDLFFKADREEKARSASQSQSQSQRPHPSFSEHRNSFVQASRSALLDELNRDSAMPSPRTVPPNNGRPPMGHRAVSSPGAAQPHADAVEEERRTRTQNLKAMLFSAAIRPSNQPNNQARTPSGSNTPNNHFHSPSPFNQQGQLSQPRSSSGPTTPQPNYCEQQQQHDNYSLHYGNRNLSPLFMASRTDTPPRPSSLRQEMASETSINADSAVALGDPYSPNTFARNYLNHTARTAGPAEMPQLPFNNHPAAFHGPTIGSSTQPVNAQHGVPEQAANTTSSAPRSNELRDMSAESAELRRMLKIF